MRAVLSLSSAVFAVVILSSVLSSTESVSIPSGPKNAFEQMLDRCCAIGTDWSNTHSTCNGYSAPVEGVAAEQQAICLSTVNICCLKLSRQRACLVGLETARMGQDCKDVPAIAGREAHKDCCKSCQLGLLASSMNLPCTLSSFKFGFPWDNSFLQCCKSPTDSHASVYEKGNVCYNNDCDQKCIAHSDMNYICACYAGYKLSDDLINCQDIDECSEGTHNCTSVTDCLNTAGGFECFSRNPGPELCPYGYVKNIQTKTCDDINECQLELDNCAPETHTCINSIGSYFCQPKASPLSQCPPGYEFSSTEQSCIDTNECLMAQDACDRITEVCVNSIGGYTCDPKPLSKCGVGFILNTTSKVCEDLNECDTQICGSDEFCLNTIGSYECYKTSTGNCPPGYKPTEDKSSCADVDECAEDLDSCGNGQACVNFEGGYKCTDEQISCSAGFKPHGSSCVDVDECSEGLAFCQEVNEKCVNLNGSYTCSSDSTGTPGIQCPSGFRLSSNNYECEDIDECRENSHQCKTDEKCINAAGSYECHRTIVSKVCSAGLAVNVASGDCEDVNECKVNNGGCNTATEVCVNLYGSFECRTKVVSTCNPPMKFSQAFGKCVLPAVLVSRPLNLTTALGDVVKFECEFDGSPIPSVTWYKDGSKQFTAENEGRVLFSNNKNKLFIMDMKKSDVGIYTCEGYNGVDYVKADVSLTLMNICDLGSHACKSTELCIPTETGYRCQPKEDRGQRSACPFGYERQGSQCVDINECQRNLHNCPKYERCDNTIGSFACSRVLDCGTGYTWNSFSRRCDDNDECELGTHHCGSGFVCVNTKGSFKCEQQSCRPGYKLSTDGMCEYVICDPGYQTDDEGNCIDVNECDDSPCRSHEVCINTAGGYSCKSRLICGNGYKPNDFGSQCIDIDECSENVDQCDEGQTCENTLGGYRCTCPPGHRLNKYRKCEDVDECVRYSGQVCAVNAVCENTVGSFRCNCKEGFKQIQDNKNCQDLNECETGHACQHKCINTWGSYQCSCNRGYELSSDGRTCTDVNECEKYKNRGKLCVGICVNEPGSYSCSCPAGFRLSSDKFSCSDIDECQEQAVCRGQNQMCLNTRGSYRCNVITCPPNYIRDSTLKNRCKRSTPICGSDDQECLKKPVSYSYNYLTFPSKMEIPSQGQVELFTMRGPRFARATSRFELRFIKSTSSDPRNKVSRGYFRMRNSGSNRAVVSLLRSIVGPQEVELELVVNMYYSGRYVGLAIAKLFIIVPEYEF